MPLNNKEDLESSLFVRPELLKQYEEANSNWNKISLNNKHIDPFCSLTPWQLSFHEIFEPNRKLLIKESSDSILTLAEKSFDNGSVSLTPIEDHWLFASNFIGPNAIDLLSESLGDLERYYDQDFPPVFISGIQFNDSDILRQIQKNLLTFFPNARKFTETEQCAASLAGGVDGFLSRRSSKHRRNLKKQANKVKKMNVQFERHIPSSIEEVTNLYARMINVELRSWKGLEQCGMAESPSKEFYEVLLQKLSSSKGSRVILARHEEKDIGYIFGSMAARVYRGQQFSFDAKYHSYSIGNLLQLEQVTWLCEEGASRYDLGPLMEYKKHWTEEVVTNHTVVLLR